MTIPRLEKSKLVFQLVSFDLTHLVVFAGKELDSHDGEDEPEDEADEEHVEDGGDGLHQGVHHHLHGSHSMNLGM